MPEGLRPTFPKCGVGSSQDRWWVRGAGRRCPGHLSLRSPGCLKMTGEPIKLYFNFQASYISIMEKNVKLAFLRTKLSALWPCGVAPPAPSCPPLPVEVQGGPELSSDRAGGARVSSSAGSCFRDKVEKCAPGGTSPEVSWAVPLSPQGLWGTSDLPTQCQHFPFRAG